MRKVALIGLVLLASLFSACQFVNTYIVVNASSKTVEVTYRIKSSESYRITGEIPSILPISQLDANVAWQPLPESRYKISSADRIVSLTLNAGEAFLLGRCSPAGGGSSGACRQGTLGIDSISIVGGKGDIYLTGEQAQSVFLPFKAKNNRYTLTYQ